MSIVRTPSEAWARAEMQGLQVTGDLFGRCHQFVHDERIVTVKVPEILLDHDNRPVAEHEDCASFRRGFVDEGRVERMAFAIAWLEITVRVKEEISLSVAMLQNSPVRPDLAGVKLSKHLNRLIIDYEGRLSAALLHWEQTVRWLSGSSGLGTPSSRVGRASATRLNGTAFRRVSDGYRYWSPIAIDEGLGAGTIDAFLWDEVGKALANGQSEPIWFQYLDDAYNRDSRRDLSGAILACAIACETLAREVFWFKNGATEDDDARDRIDRLPISGIIRKWRLLTDLPDAASHVSRVERVFTLRNRLMHAGGKDTIISEAEVRELVIAARAFIRTGDEWYFAERQLPNPRCLVAQHRGSAWPPYG